MVLDGHCYRVSLGKLAGTGRLELALASWPRGKRGELVRVTCVPEQNVVKP